MLSSVRRQLRADRVGSAPDHRRHDVDDDQAAHAAGVRCRERDRVQPTQAETHERDALVTEMIEERRVTINGAVTSSDTGAKLLIES